jgi:hypothetical protein
MCREHGRRSPSLLASMRGRKRREDRAFGENDHAICVGSTLLEPRRRDGRPAKRKANHPLMGLVARYVLRRERSGNRDISQPERSTELRALPDRSDRPYQPCNDAFHRDGNTREGASLQSCSTRSSERQLGGQTRPATRWKEVYAIGV